MMSVCFGVDVYKCKEQCGVYAYVDEDFNFVCAY